MQHRKTFYIASGNCEAADNGALGKIWMYIEFSVQFCDSNLLLPFSK